MNPWLSVHPHSSSLFAGDPLCQPPLTSVSARAALFLLPTPRQTGLADHNRSAERAYLPCHFARLPRKQPEKYRKMRTSSSRRIKKVPRSSAPSNGGDRTSPVQAIFSGYQSFLLRTQQLYFSNLIMSNRGRAAKNIACSGNGGLGYRLCACSHAPIGRGIFGDDFHQFFLQPVGRLMQ
jgi:hypothetical protein